MLNSWKSEAIFATDEQNLNKLKEIFNEDPTRDFTFTIETGKNLLHFASEKKSAFTLPLIQWLLEKHLDPLALDENFESAMEIAKKKNNIPALALMKHNLSLKEQEIQDWLY